MTTPGVEQHHLALVDLIYRAYFWTRRFLVATHAQGDNDEALSLFPLRS